jgi:hypothetical protein
MSEGALTQIRRVAISKEDGAIYATAAGHVNLRGLEDVQADADFERIADNRQRTSRLAGTASRNGPKKWELSGKAPLHSGTQTDLDYLFENVSGAAATTGAAVTATGTATTVTKTAGAFGAPALLLTTASGKEVRPIKSDDGANAATLAIRGSANSSAAENPAYFYTATPTGSETTLCAQWDRDSETDTVNYSASGGVCDRLAIEIDTEGRVAFDFHIMGADWDDSDQTPSELAAPSPDSGYFLGYAAEVFLQDIGTPAVGAQVDMAGLSLNLAPAWTARKAARANISGVVPGSPVTGWKRGPWFGEAISLTVSKNATAYKTAIKNRTAYGFMVSWSLGGPGATATDARMALWVPRVIITAAVPTDLDGIEGCQLTLEVEEESLTAPYLAPWFLAFFA